MNLVAAFFHDDVGHATQCATVFGFDTRTLDLDFVDEIEGNVRVRITADVVGCILAFDEVSVFRVRSATDLVSGGSPVRTSRGRAAACAGEIIVGVPPH